MFLASRIDPVPAEARLVCVGRLCPEKGQNLLVEAVARLRQQGVTCHVTLVGDGPLRGVLEALVERHGLRQSVHLVGWRSSEDVRSEILRSRALVMPSLAEGLPVAIIEALALGRPVISTYVAGIPELVENRASGWLIPAGSVEALVVAMREAIASPAEEIQRMGRAGAERVRQQHELRAEVDKLESLIQRCSDLPTQPPGSIQEQK